MTPQKPFIYVYTSRSTFYYQCLDDIWCISVVTFQKADIHNSGQTHIHINHTPQTTVIWNPHHNPWYMDMQTQKKLKANMNCIKFYLQSKYNTNCIKFYLQSKLTVTCHIYGIWIQFILFSVCWCSENKVGRLAKIFILIQIQISNGLLPTNK